MARYRLETEEHTVCTDCLMIIANDDASSMDDTTEQACRAGIHEFAKRGWSLAATGESEDFSWRPCECCGSSLGGARHNVCAVKNR